MRLVYFNFTNNFGGGPQTMLAVAQGLARRHEVHILDAYGRCQPYLEAIRRAGLAYQVLLPEARHTYIGGRGRVGRLWAAMRQSPELLQLRLRLVHALRRLRPDVVWVMNGKSLAFVGGGLRGPDFAIALWVVEWARPGQIAPWLIRMIRRRVDAVLAVSTATREELRRAGAPEQKLHIGGTPLDLEAIRHKAAQPLATPVPGAEGALKILLLGARPERAKGYHTAVRALARVVGEGLDAVLWLPGRPAVGAGEDYVQQLRALAKELGVADRTHLLGWRDDMPQLIAASDICILPSHTEGLSRAVLEAMVLGKPVAVTPVGGMCDVIEDGRTGLLFDVEDDAGLAACIQRLARDRAWAGRIGQAGQALVCHRFDPDRVIGEIEALYARIARRGRG